MTFEYCSMEEEARTIMHKAFERGWEDWGLVERVLAKAFMADWSSERSRDSWVKLGEVLENVSLEFEGQDSQARIKMAFNRMVRAGYLYSKNVQGKRNYGISFS